MNTKKTKKLARAKNPAAVELGRRSAAARNWTPEMYRLLAQRRWEKSAEPSDRNSG